MKKTVLIVILLLIVIGTTGFFLYNNYLEKQEIIKRHNAIFEKYSEDNINGLDVATVINKAINNNEENNVLKKVNEKDIEFYEDDKKSSLIIEVKMIINGKIYRMEQISALGIDSFSEYFAEVKFECKEIKYHSTGNIAYMLFEAKQM